MRAKFYAFAYLYMYHPIEAIGVNFPNTPGSQKDNDAVLINENVWISTGNGLAPIWPLPELMMVKFIVSLGLIGQYISNHSITLRIELSCRIKCQGYKSIYKQA